MTMIVSSRPMLNRKERDTVRSMNEVFRVAQERGIITNVKRLDEIEGGEITRKEWPKPTGYTAHTIVYFGGKAVTVMLDYCTSASVIPEEVAIMIIQHADNLVERDKMDTKNRLYPISKIEKI